ncbi:hypothetical protein RB653_004842 [Dictyostelium firmibasis]|uniref:Fcf2 pre-rRNA processing C-terminal domain-containing protein n=1 Tax=Dictyostelium firmibasis TaxID=79012 RepID=A0AAN7YYN8_9MYCE
MSKTKKSNIDQNYDVLNLNNVSLTNKNKEDTTTNNKPKKSGNDILDDEFKLIDQLAKNTAVHLNKLVNQQKILNKNSQLGITKIISNKEFKNSAPSKLDLLKKSMKPIVENTSVLETKPKVDRNLKNKGWYGFGSKEVTDEMKLEANLIKLQKYIDPTRRANKSQSDELPEHFEIGVFENSNVDYYNRFTNREKKRGALGDILDNEKAIRYIEEKSDKIIQDNRKLKKHRKNDL